MITYFQAIIFGILQGVTELFPISSLGHSIILPKLIGWNINQNDPLFLDFIVATHAATALVLFFFFIKDWKRLMLGILRSLKNRTIDEKDQDAKLAWLLVVATIPAGLLGVSFQDFFKSLFADPRLVSAVLILNGVMLFSAERLRKRAKENTILSKSDQRIAKLSWAQGIKVGLLQCIALIPGFSRTGATMTGSLLVGLSHEDSIRFSFLLATPIIAAAAVLKLPDLFLVKIEVLGPILLGMVLAGFAAAFSVTFLTRYFKRENLWPFAIYCVVLGALSSLIFLFR